MKDLNINNTALNIKITRRLHTNLESEADRKSVSVAALVRMILSDYFEGKES